MKAPVPSRRTRRGLFVDANLLVLLTVGSVGRDRIAKFKRTSHYTVEDFDLLKKLLDENQPLLTSAHMMAEVSNLTDLKGAELLIARNVLRLRICRVFEEPTVSSIEAADHPAFGRLGLTDAGVCEIAKRTKCRVLTDDFDLYFHLQRQGSEALNFSHIRAQSWGIED